MLLEAVRRAIYWNVDRAVALGAVDWVMGLNVYKAVTDTMSRSMHRARRGAGAPHEESLHPGLALYLGSVD